MKWEELIHSKEYWMSKLQIDLFNEVEDYMKKKQVEPYAIRRKIGCNQGIPQSDTKRRS